LFDRSHKKTVGKKKSARGGGGGLEKVGGGGVGKGIYWKVKGLERRLGESGGKCQVGWPVIGFGGKKIGKRSKRKTEKV